MRPGLRTREDAGSRATARQGELVSMRPGLRTREDTQAQMEAHARALSFNEARA